MSFLKKIAPMSLRGVRCMSTGPDRKVTIVGAAGGIGQSLSMLMKMSPNLSKLALYDVMGTPGVAADCSHMNTKATVTGHVGPDELDAALDGADVVVIPAGVPRKPGMTRDDLFKINAGIVMGIAEGIAKNCPNALICMISNPVNSTVPIAAETLKKKGVYDPKKLFGVTTLDVVRAKTFYADKKGLPVVGTDVPVVGGHAGITILPLFSQATPQATLTDEEREALTVRTQDGGTEVVAAKAGKGSATLSMAYAGALFADSCLRALNGQKDVIECTYVESPVVPGLEFFATKVRIGTNGVEEIFPIGEINEYEAGWLEKMKEELASSIKKGKDFVKEN
uniref:Malate dehydrogenase n=1 Tax=Pyramimonas obovata TaxID=1411642 RepID=A0A7S0RN61_9CHLO|mmetsp:Transcript_38614/g.83960  ORF Transcript_38614/g.83960 Transcript_38614/m.83960 type:complete len:338 (+) Transcript_38614:75-1088(+)|eukprot:CAMPEP_0118932970 /NCGR_PEP_ID=MMETSP1169-20130426/10827_1 /TAXON_ID=36882 /ORGANISM="Pyramimonas obovata, Strain CCMP722" /LENGTH=337 /DNA_ID=CAMNT_0006875679 /DNA_START=62 /DNA_END=1075 /DNA_ORIENTATION=+